MALIRVDGQPLLEIIRELESPIASAEGEPNLAGAYDYLNGTDGLSPSRQLLGEAARPLLSDRDKVSVLECDCGCKGCWPLLMRITVTNDAVVWSDPEPPHRQNWVGSCGESGGCPFDWLP